MGRKRSYAERAASCRRWAKGARITAYTFGSLAVAVLTLGTLVGLTSGWSSGPISIISAFIIGANAFSIRLSASGFEETAKTWDRLARSEGPWARIG